MRFPPPKLVLVQVTMIALGILVIGAGIRRDDAAAQAFRADASCGANLGAGATSGGACSVFDATIALAGAAPGAHGDDATALMRGVNEAHANSVRGVVVFDVTTHTQIRGGPYHRDDLEKAAYVAVDGKPLRKRVLQLVEGGHAAAGDALQRASAKPDGPLSRFGMQLPYASDAFDAYAFDAPRAESDGTVVGFRTKVRDEAHGDGTMVLDAQRRPMRIVFHPAKLPEHVSEATVTVEFGTVGTGRWDVTRIVRAFSGRLGFIRGHVEATSSYDGYRTFATPELAQAAIDRE